MTELLESAASTNGQPTNGQAQLSLSTAAARNLATTTKTPPQMQEITSRWLLKLLPWVEASGGVYRVNRRLSYTVGDGRVTFVSTGDDVRVIAGELRELPLLRDFDDDATLQALADRFVQRQVEPGGLIAAAGQDADEVFLIAHGKAQVVGIGKYGDEVVVQTLTDGDHFGDDALLESDDYWPNTIRAVTACTVLVLAQQVLEELIERSDVLRTHIETYRTSTERAQNKHGEAAIDMSSGHEGEPDLPGTFVDYDVSPREYELSVAQTVLRVHTRVADLYNEPMNQLEQQLRLTIEALRERQENEMVNNRSFGLLHNADLTQRIPTRTGPPTPDDMDELLSRRRKTRFFLAHPRAIAAFGRECNRRGLYPTSVDVDGHKLPAWRDVPIFPCGKIPVTPGRTTSILAMRTGEDDQGVVGLRQTGLPDEYEPGLNVRFMGINEKAIMSYLVSTYYSAAVLVPDALGILEDVEIGRTYD